jgi:hypothetical protein
LQQQHLGHTDVPAGLAVELLLSTVWSAAAAASPADAAAADVNEGADGL